MATRLGMTATGGRGLGGDDETERFDAVSGQICDRRVAGSVKVAGSPARLGQIEPARSVEKIASG